MIPVLCNRAAMYKRLPSCVVVCWRWVGRCPRRSWICSRVCSGTCCAVCCTGPVSAWGSRCRLAVFGAASPLTTSDCRRGTLRSSTWNSFSSTSPVRQTHIHMTMVQPWSAYVIWHSQWKLEHFASCGPGAIPLYSFTSTLPQIPYLLVPLTFFTFCTRLIC